MSRLVGPDGKLLGPSEEQQRKAIAGELASGRMAMRILSAILAQTKGRRAVIRKVRLAQLQKQYPNAVVRFSETVDHFAASLLTPAELDAADRHVAQTSKERREIVELSVPKDEEPVQ